MEILKKIKLENGGIHYLTPVLVEGKEAHYLEDTGATHSVISERYINLCCGLKTRERKENFVKINGINEASGSLINIKLMEIGHYKFEGDLQVVELGNIDAAYISAKSPLLIDGILGNDLLTAIGYWQWIEHFVYVETRVNS
jgi:predicted aspartyl protease